MIKIADITLSPSSPLLFILGPCVIESEELAMKTAAKLVEISPAPFIYKSSFDKANRSSLTSFRGVGIEQGLKILQRVKEEFKIPVVTDIHLPDEAAEVASVCDMIQIPAFLCRQTDLLVAAAKTGKPLLVKKGQFMSPQEMKNVVEKIRESGNDQILLTERGFCLGYNNLVVDMRSIPIMKALGCPVCFDASHSIMLPGGHGTSSSGQIEFLPTLAKSAVAAGASAIFIETHPNPKEAKSDRDSQIPLDELAPLLETLYELAKFVQARELCLSKQS